MRNVVLIMTIAVAGFASAEAFAHPVGHARRNGPDHPRPEVSAVQDGTANTTILRPVQAETVITTRRPEFKLVLQFEGDPNGAISAFDHAHYGVGPVGSGIAEECAYTSPDRTGIVDVDLDATLGHIPNISYNGAYEVCAYMARADHLRLDPQIRCVQFTLYASGVQLVSPAEGDTFTNFDVLVLYGFFGPESKGIKYTIDDGETLVHEGSTSLELPPLDNGLHRVQFSAVDAQGEIVGPTVTRSFRINSPLSEENVRSALGLLNKAKRSSDAGGRKSNLAKIDKVLDPMSKAEGVNPTHPKLNAENSGMALKLAKAAKRATGNNEKFNRTVNRLKKSLASLLSS